MLRSAAATLIAAGFVLLAVVPTAQTSRQPSRPVSREESRPQAGSTAEPARFARVGELITDAIANQQLPGAVVLIGRGDDVLYRQAFGRRAILPKPEPMTEDTIFDLASLTKVVATTTSIMQLVEAGKIRLNDPAARYIPEFGRYGKEAISIRHLMTHVSGLRPDLELEVEFNGVEEAIRRA